MHHEFRSSIDGRNSFSTDEIIFFRKIFLNWPFPVEFNDAKIFELAGRQEKLLELEAFS